MPAPHTDASPPFEVRTHAKGRRGVHALAAFTPGETITPFDAPSARGEAIGFVRQAGEDRHIELVPEALVWLNHACEPNVAFDFDRGLVIALRPIDAGDELFLFYPATEWDHIKPFTCHCGTPSCLGKVRGAKHLPPEKLRHHVLSPHLRRLLGLRAHWWERDGLRYDGDVLMIGNRSLQALSRSLPDTPVYIVDAARVLSRLDELRAAMTGAFLPARLFYSLKANHNQALLAHLAASGRCDIDVCSPAELLRALACGFEEAQTSYTGTSLSDSDLDVLAQHPEVRVNLDSQGSIERLAKRSPGRSIGLRVNPERGIGTLHYAGDRPTKFGIYASELDDAIARVKRSGLKLRGVHWHLGWGLLGDGLGALDIALATCRALVDRLGPLDWIDIGGGLGVPRSAVDRPVDPVVWARLVAKHLGGCAREIAAEPGTFVTMDAGVLLMPVTNVEVKSGVRFVSVSAGLNLNVNAAYYGLTLPIVPVRRSSSPLVPSSVVGNINESIDVFVEGLPLPSDLAPGDALAMLCGGGYGSSMASTHCLRGHFEEYVLPPRRE